MATANKVFVSPGVYTSETDLSFVAQSVGVTTLGLVGETQKGPAFEPIFITNYDEFQTYFGGTLPDKFVNTQIPKYEAAYIAKAYLQQSNQLFVSRILGLSGYDAGPSWSIKVVANVDKDTVAITNSGGTNFSVTFSGNSTTSSSVEILDTLPYEINNILNNTYQTYSGSESSINEQLTTQLFDILSDTPTSATSIYYFGSIATDDYTEHQNTTYTDATNVYNVPSVSYDATDLTSGENDPWFYSQFDNYSSNSYSGFSFYSAVIDLVDLGSSSYSGTVSGSVYTFSGTAFSDYNNMVIATLRSRGIATYSTDTGPVYTVSGTNDVQLVTTGQYSGVTTNPYSTFQISGETAAGDAFTFDTSFTNSDTNYLTKVLGRGNFDKPRNEVPLFVEEQYYNLFNWAYKKGYIKGISSDLVSLTGARTGGAGTIAWYLQQYQTPETPYVVSELRGNRVYKLFKVISISDGNAANTEVKVSFLNMDFNNLTFDVVVRDYFDNDSNPVVLEKFTNCSMDPTTNSFVGVKIGTSDGEYSLNSRFIMIELSDEAPTDALPCGFEGYVTRQYSSTANPSPFPVYKTKYDYPGETIYDPPFGDTLGNANTTTSSGDNKRRVYLGFSTQIGYDSDFLQYKGQQLPNDICTATESTPWNVLTKGFHMDSGATAVTIANAYTTSGDSAFFVGDSSFQSNPTSQTNSYYYTYSRKFTVLLAGGFDGWDIYRENRTNQDQFVLGGSGYLKGACSTDPRYPSATGSGTFKRITVGNNTQDYANTDYYAYLLGIETFNNPESTNINVFATSSIDYVNNSNLVDASIDMIENDRADSVYICTTPDTDMYSAVYNTSDFIYPQEAVDTLDDSGIDSNYTATYYPWILVRDTVNNTQIYLPATGEVCRNLALTDNVSFPWFATAGYTRGLVNSVKARKKLTQEDRDTLYEGRINPIATFSDVGTVIWGNKTLQVRESALDRLNVRRLLLQTRKLISAVAVRLLFEQNDEIVRQQFLDSVNPILDSIRRDRGIYDFRVTVSSDPADLDRNTLTGKIYLKPTKALEFIDIEFLITPAGASFENI